MKYLIASLLIFIAAGANGQGIDRARPNSGKAFNELSIADKMKVMKQMSPVVLKHEADSICKAHNIVLKDDKGQPVDINKAIADNKLLIENGVVFYLQYGLPSPTVKKQDVLPTTKN